MKYTQKELDIYAALRDLIKAHDYDPDNTMEGMEKQLDDILGDIDPRCEDY